MNKEDEFIVTPDSFTQEQWCEMYIKVVEYAQKLKIEIERLNNIINELEKMLDGDLDGFLTINEKGACNDIIEVIQNYKDKLKELKEDR